MALDTASTQQPIISSSPRIISVYDTVAGCPNASRANPLLTTTITITRPSYFWVFSNLRRNASGRADYQIVVGGPAGSNYSTPAVLTRRLNWTANTQPITVAGDVGFFANTAGSWNVYIQADSPTLWGCERQWGKMFVMVCEV